MEERRSCFNCKRLESYTSPCPHKEDETLISLRGFLRMDYPDTVVSGRVFDKACEIAVGCNLFEKRKG
jgi:hypothetical protein